MLVIDADQMVYSCGFATEGEPLENTLQAVKQSIHTIMEKAVATKPEIFIGGSGNFREEIVTDYKANRTSRKPLAYNEIRKYLIDTWDAQAINGMEADDVVSSMLWTEYEYHEGVREECEVIVYSNDKDLLNTPGWHLNAKSEEPYWVSELQAHRHFLYQMLRGDPVDNIKGLETVPKAFKEEYGMKSHRCGEAGAKLIISKAKDEADLLKTIAFLYCQQDDCLYNFWNTATLLWMARDIDHGVPRNPVHYLNLKAINDGVEQHITNIDWRSEDETDTAHERYRRLQSEGSKTAEECMSVMQRDYPIFGGDS